MTFDKLEQGGASARIWRDAPHWDGERTAAVSHLRCREAAEGAALLNTACDALRGEGFSRVIGPMEGDTWHSYRLVTETDGSPPFLMEPTSAPQDNIAFQGAGFRDIAHYFSARAPIEAALGAAPEPDPAMHISTWDGEDPEAHFSTVHALSTRAFANNLFYKPISLETFLGMYMPFVPMLRRELIFLAHDDTGDLVGYLFGIPNYAEGPQPGTVILKTYASLRPGTGHQLSHAFHTAAHALGFKTVIHALIQDDNLSAERSRKHGAHVFRRYALLGRRL